MHREQWNWRKPAVIVLGLALNAAMPVQSATEIDRTQLEKRLGAVSILLESSSASRQIDASGDARALERREQARATYRRARAAFESGNYTDASTMLGEASTRMLEAVRYAAPEQVVAPKQQADFDARLESVRALAAAQKRIALEKPGTAGVAEAARTIEKLVAEAQAHAAAKDLGQARSALDQAYLIAKASVASMRTGDTLVRSLNFASAEEEYRYELDRNDTHDMLIKVLLKDKTLSAHQRSFMDLARDLRGRADTAARNGDHGGAVKLLEESTRELVRAIRSAGVFIPG